MRALAISAVGLALVVAAVSGAVIALFTPHVFDMLGFHPVALEYMDGQISRVEMSQMLIEGQSFGAAEIDHLDDVAALLGVLRWMFVAAAAMFVAALLARPRVAHIGAAFALTGLVVTGAVVVAAYLIFGFVPVGEVFHEVLFPQGNWRFPWYALIIRLYGTQVMLSGAAFVIALGLAGVVAGLAAGILAARRRRG